MCSQLIIHDGDHSLVNPPLQIQNSESRHINQQRSDFGWEILWLVIIVFVVTCVLPICAYEFMCRFYPYNPTKARGSVLPVHSDPIMIRTKPMTPNIARLEHQLQILKDIKSANLPFDMATWAEYDECGTVFCAFGYAALDMKFRHQGLRLRGLDVNNVRVYFETKEQFEAIERSKQPCWIHAALVEYNGYVGFKAVSKFFDIPHEEAMYLFDSSAYNDPSIDEVIDRLESFIKKVSEKRAAPEDAALFDYRCGAARKTTFSAPQPLG